jgi:hypothetical protein
MHVLTMSWLVSADSALTAVDRYALLVTSRSHAAGTQAVRAACCDRPRYRARSTSPMTREKARHTTPVDRKTTPTTLATSGLPYFSCASIVLGDGGTRYFETKPNRSNAITAPTAVNATEMARA